jgi:VIT1/CCC1 family predicted Fe2+/Mn2+ transporter
MSDPSEIQRFRRNLRDELDGAALYAALSAAERDPVRKDLFLQLSRAEAEHAKVWRDKLAAAGAGDVRFSISLRTRMLAALARRFGPAFVLPAIASAEFADRDKYASQADAAALSAEERGHAAVINAVASNSASHGVTGAEIAKAEPWHRRGGGNELRAAVLGANDGLVSNFCLVMGVAGAGAPTSHILLTGLAGLIAGAISMAMGEWLSVTNARELARTQIDREREELEQSPESERKELALIFQAKGLQREEAQRVAANLMRDKRAALDTLTREELGIDPAELGGNPWTAAGFSFALFAAGAALPVLPFVFATGNMAILASAGVGAASLAAIGLVTSIFSGRSALYSMVRQLLFGLAAAGVTYGTGHVIGVAIS